VKKRPPLIRFRELHFFAVVVVAIEEEEGEEQDKEAGEAEVLNMLLLLLLLLLSVVAVALCSRVRSHFRHIDYLGFQLCFVVWWKTQRERETDRENQSTLATRTEYHALSHVFVFVVVVFSFFPRRRESSSSSSSRRRGVKTKSILLREDFCIFPRVDVVTRKKKKKKRRRR